MTWFVNLWNSIGLLGQVFLTVAIPATVIMILQTLLLLIGISFGGDVDGGVDADGDVDVDVDGDLEAHDIDGLRLFTVRGIVAMFAVGGWIGVALCDIGAHPALSVVCATVSGLLALFVAAYVIKLSLKLQDDGNMNIKNAVAHTATVYIPIPPARSGTGKVTMNLQERFVELDAMTDSAEKLTTGTIVQVVSVTDKNEVIVRPIR
ncbi:MAG: hypothetical protein IKM46_09465 [Clostridia bacterium]|nr:hypothetical protein [Clostridia bacterium]